MENIKVRVDIAKFKVLYFAGVLGASSFLFDKYKKILSLFGHPNITRFIIIFFILLLLFYGIAGIIKNIMILTKIDKELK